MPRRAMHPRVLTLLFALLLLAMQQQAQQHALAHFAEQLHRPHEQTAQLPVDDTCALCALYAGGASTLPSDDATPDEPPVGFVAPFDAELSAAPSPPAYYLSRAPPSSR